MLIVMKADATDSQVEAVLRVIEELGFKPHPMPGATRTAIGITGNQGAVDPSHFETLAGVAEAIRVSKPYKLISLDLRPEKTIIRVGDATIGGDELAIIAGPCAVESRTQAFAIAETIRRSGGFNWPKSEAVMSRVSRLRSDSAAKWRSLFGILSMSTSPNVSSEPNIARRRLDAETNCCSKLSTFALLPSYRKKPSGAGSEIVAPPTEIASVPAGGVASREQEPTDNAANKRL